MILRGLRRDNFVSSLQYQMFLRLYGTRFVLGWYIVLILIDGVRFLTEKSILYCSLKMYIHCVSIFYLPLN
jgi:hypothetical protein